MRGHSYPLAIKKYCLKHRQKGLSLNELVQIFKIPKSTIHDWVSDQPLSNRAMINIRSKIILGQKRGIEIARKISTKVIPQPDYWTPGLTSIVAHFLFDGYPTSKKDGFVYCGRNLSQIQRMSKLIKNVFGLESHYRKNENEVIKSTNFSVNLYKYISRKKKELLQILPKAPIEIKLAFLKAFFDDEGTVATSNLKFYSHNKKLLQDLMGLILLKFKEIKKISDIRERNKIQKSGKLSKEYHFVIGARDIEIYLKLVGSDHCPKLEEIRFIYIPLVKKNKGTEPTFEALYRFLKRFNL